jgi:hypothetical protein
MTGSTGSLLVPLLLAMGAGGVGPPADAEAGGVVPDVAVPAGIPGSTLDGTGAPEGTFVAKELVVAPSRGALVISAGPLVLSGVVAGGVTPSFVSPLELHAAAPSENQNRVTE